MSTFSEQERFSLVLGVALTAADLAESALKGEDLVSLSLAPLSIPIFLGFGVLGTRLKTQKSLIIGVYEWFALTVAFSVGLVFGIFSGADNMLLGIALGLAFGAGVYSGFIGFMRLAKLGFAWMGRWLSSAVSRRRGKGPS